ncbi:MAG TPA: hypothetical protein VGM26_08050 [Rhizomicrobium sp.]
MKKIALLCVLLAISDAYADPRDDALSAMLRCSAVTDRSMRLGCYDATVARAPGALNQQSAKPAFASATPAPAAPVAPRQQRSSGFISSIFGPDGPARPPQTSAAQFGSESIVNDGARAWPIAMEGDTIDQISARLIAYSFDGGFITVTLDNGQVWRQTPGNAPVGHLSKPALAYSAVIGRGGPAGSYGMKLGGVGGTIAVRRLR